MKRIVSIGRVLATSFLLIGAASFVAVIAVPEAAIAKNGNGGENGGGKGGGKGNGGENAGGKSSGKSGEKSAKAKGGAETKSKGTGKGLLGAIGLKKTDKQKSARAQASGQNKPGLLGTLENLVKGNKKTAKVVTKSAVVDEEYIHPNQHGKIASELKGLNAAHASQTALLNASPNSMPGKLYTYQQSILGYTDASTDLSDKQMELDTLLGMEEDEIPTKFAPTEDELLDNPELTAQDKYDAAVEEAQLALDEAEKTLAETDPQEALDTLTGGRELSDDALNELHDLLDLPAPEEYEVSIDDGVQTLPENTEEEVIDG